MSDAVDELCELIAKADALAHSTEESFDHVIRVEDADDRRRLERLAHLVGATAEAVQQALDASYKLAGEIATRESGA